MTTNTSISALEKTIHSEATGTEPTRHVLLRYVVDLPNKMTVATLGCYMSATAKQPVDSINVQLQLVPHGEQDVYAAILAQPGQMLSGATAIHAAEWQHELVSHGHRHP